MNRQITARAPGKVILFGEHAINRGQPALAASVGLYATCRLAPSGRRGYRFRSRTPGGGDARTGEASREEIVRLGREVDGFQAAEAYEGIRRLASADFFAPTKYILASALGEALPEGLEIEFGSEIPQSCGLGSGGAAFAALACALAAWRGEGDGKRADDRERLADWAHRGDVIAHGGVASRLDTQTSLCGGVIRYVASRPPSGSGRQAAGVRRQGGGLGEPVPCAAGLRLVIGNTGVVAATSEVNARVREWLGASPVARMRYFEAMGVIARNALAPLRNGDWARLGHLMTLNQVLLE
ncbi:MAG: mevalonate kinase family protein, partial [Chloroflexota bacterium]